MCRPAHRKLAATGKAEVPEAALRMALSHAENQARNYRDRKIETKRLPKEEKSDDRAAGHAAQVARHSRD